MSQAVIQRNSEVQIIKPETGNQSLATRSFMSSALSIQQMAMRRDLIMRFVAEIMKPDVDYGEAFAGSKDKTLKKPGAEKLCTLFQYTPIPSIIEKVEDWTGTDHNGEPFFYYLYRYNLYDGDRLVAAADGSCSTFESKYRYRKSERECPKCGSKSIIKSKPEYGGGWYCNPNKNDGCGGKFREKDEDITRQQTGRVLNIDVCDQQNTVLKMAQKRAIVAATLLAVNASDLFTQDLEDFDYTEINGEDAPRPSAKNNKPKVVGTDQKKKEQAKASGNGKVDSTDFWIYANENGIERKQALSIAEKYDPPNWGAALAALQALVGVSAEPTIEESATPASTQPKMATSELELVARRKHLDALITTALKHSNSRDAVDRVIASACDGLIYEDQMDAGQIEAAIQELEAWGNW